MADDTDQDTQAAEPDTEQPEAHGPAPPGLPEIRDEAGDTPRWVPMLGLGLLVALLALFGLQLLTQGEQGADAAEEAGAA
ncbi:MAG: hypothetical protein ACODAU_13070, partial [Myxococcota bacterium]